MNSRGPRVAFQGEHGAFSEEAARKLLGEGIELIPRLTFEALFRSFEDGVADYVVAPVENTLAGVIRRVHDLLAEGSLSICNEVTIPIAQHLIGCPGSRFENIRAAESHPVALAQCE